MKTQIISVTQEDIDAGVQKDCSLCPIARAFRRAFEPAFVLVRSYSADINGVRVELPDVAVEFIDNFDEGRPVSPFTFELEVPV